MVLAKRISALLVTTVLGLALGLSAATAAERTKFTVLLDWFVNPDHAPLYVALERGYFRDAGLDVVLIAPADPNDPPKLVAAGKGDVAITYQPQLYLQVDQGLPLVRIGTLVDRPLNSLVVLANGPIRRIADLKGRRIGYSVGGFEEVVLGTMLASAAQRLIRLYGVRPGRRAVVVTANGDGYGAALDLLAAGIEVAAVADLRAEPPDCTRAAAVRDHGVRVMAGYAPWEARPGPGKRGVTGMTLARITGRGECRDGTVALDCDLVCMAAGYAPVSQLLSHAGGRMGYDPATAMFDIRACPEGMVPAGSVNGAYDLDAVVAEGRHAGWRAARAYSQDRAGAEPVLPNDRGGHGQTHPWPIYPHPKGKDFVDFDEDLQVHDIRDAIAEGYDHIELLKRFTTNGMGDRKSVV